MYASKSTTLKTDKSRSFKLAWSYCYLCYSDFDPKKFMTKYSLSVNRRALIIIYPKFLNWRHSVRWQDWQRSNVYLFQPIRGNECRSPKIPEVRRCLRPNSRSTYTQVHRLGQDHCSGNSIPEYRSIYRRQKRKHSFDDIVASAPIAVSRIRALSFEYLQVLTIIIILLFHFEMSVGVHDWRKRVFRCIDFVVVLISRGC